MNFALEARTALALSRVNVAINPELYEKYREAAYDNAHSAGMHSTQLSPYLDGEPLLMKAHRDGVEESRLYEAHQEMQAEVFNNRQIRANGTSEGELPVVLAYADMSMGQQAAFDGRQGIRQADRVRIDLKLHSTGQSSTAPYDFESLLKAASAKAVRSSGQSFELYEKLMHSAYVSILANAPAAERAATEFALLEHGYDPEFVPYQSKPGECSLTGIDTNCCPCGYHE